MNELTNASNHELSSDINTITAEINAYQRVAGEAIFEIGRRLKHVKENDLAHGEWERWIREDAKMSPGNARKFIKVAEELATKRSTSNDIGLEALYQIATLPPDSRDVPHELPTGETKKPDEMTVRELRELKRQLKQAEQQTEAERRERERLELENEELRNKEPEHIESGPYDRTLDEPYAVERANDFYELMNDVDRIYKQYSHLTDAIDELSGIAYYDGDLRIKYEKAEQFWNMLSDIFNSDGDSDIIDVEII